MQLDPVCGNTQRLRQRSLEQSSMSEDADPSDGDLCSVDFEIFGYVQGVCFRMYTERKGLDLGLVGWVKNTSKGTVMGQVQGPQHLVNEMGQYLQARARTKSPATNNQGMNDFSRMILCFGNQMCLPTIYWSLR
ncbi:acylphosphatase 2, muscle type isoform X5 [Brachyhypopomus gauderio]|uniref:acylphosphatase 2, muscle type isoform X5 n=1 Tax=Brachyhypopomus gauderio TaxID=698409 RepID=UPI00404307EC